jgi:probable phosphoglycerate mutase
LSSAQTPNPRLFLIRHGETEWSLSGRHTGSTDLSLTPHGEEEARALGRLLAGVSFARVLTSPKLRARQTAELAGLGGAEIEPDLAEWSYGDYEGRRSVDIWQERPGWDIFRDGCPGGETPDEAASRADRLLDRLVNSHGDIALVSHGHFGRVLAVRWIGLTVSAGRHFATRTASLGILARETNALAAPVITLWNEAPEHGSAGA